MQWTTATWESRSETLYRCKLSRIYHQKRARFLWLCGLRGQARRHTELAKAFIDLESRVVTLGIFNDKQAAAFEGAVLRIEIDEPRPLRALVQICQNEIARSRGDPTVPVSLMERLFAQIYDFD